MNNPIKILNYSREREFQRFRLSGIPLKCNDLSVRLLKKRRLGECALRVQAD